MSKNSSISNDSVKHKHSLNAQLNIRTVLSWTIQFSVNTVQCQKTVLFEIIQLSTKCSKCKHGLIVKKFSISRYSV